MKELKQAIEYYNRVTGNGYTDFIVGVQNCMLDPAPTGDMWLLQNIVKSLEQHSKITIHDIMEHKDTIKGVLDSDSRKLAGEYFTPDILAREGRAYIRKHLPDFDNLKVWDNSCGTGNLLKTSKHPHESMYLSTLQMEDVQVVRRMFPNAHVWQSDFLADLDRDEVNTFYLDTLPSELKQAILNNEKTVIYINPPYNRNAGGKSTYVGRYMSMMGYGCGCSDTMYQFIYKLTSIKEMFNWTNLYIAMITPQQIFTLHSCKPIRDYFYEHFGYLGGFCTSNSIFEGTMQNATWAVCMTLWTGQGTNTEQDSLLLDKLVLQQGSFVKNGSMLLREPEELATQWVKPKDATVMEEKPIMVGALSFRGEEKYVMKCKESAKLTQNALGVFMTANSVMFGNKHSALMTMPVTSTFEAVTKENLDRVVAFYTAKRVVTITWTNSRATWSAPKIAEGYDQWLADAYVYMAFEFSNQTCSMRGVDFKGVQMDIVNNLFPLKRDFVLQYVADENIRMDAMTHPIDETYADRIAGYRDKLSKEAEELLTFCTNVILNSYALRASTDSKYQLGCWDASFKQIRLSELWSNELEEVYNAKVVALRDRLKEGSERFGFIIEGEIDELS